ncbi:hypothetical protein D3C80_2167230 [compost metagenome]
MECQTNRHRSPRIHLDADQRKAVINNEELHKKRRALKDGDVAGSQALQYGNAGCACQGDKKAGNASEQEGNH